MTRAPSELERADAARDLLARFIASSAAPARVCPPRRPIARVLRSAAVVLASAGLIVAYTLLGATAEQTTGSSVRTRLRPHGPATSVSVRGPVPVAVPRAARLPAFVWKPAAGAATYELRLFRGPERIFVARTEEPRLSLPRRWVFRGRQRRLTPGSYRWYVWPLGGRGPAARAARPIVRAKLVVSG